MATLIKQWPTGTGNLSVTYDGDGDGTAVFTSDANEGIDRVMNVAFNAGDIVEQRIVTQEGLRQPFGLNGGGVFRIKNGGRYGVLKVGEPIVPPTPMETYTRLTYIEATGEQYIDLGYVVKEDDVIEVDYIRTSSTSADKALFGASDGTNGIWYSIYGSNAYYRFGHNASDNASGAGNRYRVKLQKGNVDVDGLTEALTFTALPDVPLYLFARNSLNTSVTMYCHCKTRGFKITKQTGEVVMELQACKRDSDGKVGMLDIVSGTFYTNSGTGEDFIAGAEIKATPEYELIDYVTFSKNKLYDLGVVKSTYTLEVMFKRSESSATPYLYGIVTSPHTASVTAYMSNGGAWRFGSSYKGLSTNNTNTNYTVIKNGSVNFNFTSGSFTKSTFTTPDTVVLGGYRAASGALTKNYQGRVYFFRINEDSTPIIDYYPCKRLSDAVEGFWDCVTQTFIEPIS